METALHGALTEQISAWFSILPDAGPKHAAPACHRFCPSYEASGQVADPPRIPGSDLPYRTTNGTCKDTMQSAGDRSHTAALVGSEGSWPMRQVAEEQS